MQWSRLLTPGLANLPSFRTRDAARIRTFAVIYTSDHTSHRVYAGWTLRHVDRIIAGRAEQPRIHEPAMASKQQVPEENQPIEVPPAVKKRIEERQVQERVAIGAHVVHETIRREGEEELNRTNSALAWSGLSAGLSMGFSLIAEGLIEAYLPRQPWTPLVSKLGYSVGFLIVVLGRQQLFTETTLTAVLPALTRRDAKTFLGVLRLWGIVLLANLVGTYLFALCVGKIPLFTPQIQRTLMEVSWPVAAGFGTVFMRSIFAGWLIALMVWLLPAAESARQHHYHHHLPDRPRWIQPHHCGIGEGAVPRRHRRDHLGAIFRQLLAAHFTWKYRRRRFAGRFPGARASRRWKRSRLKDRTLWPARKSSRLARANFHQCLIQSSPHRNPIPLRCTSLVRSTAITLVSI